MYLVLLGPPGSGKGTYSKKLVEQFGFYHFATGDILRSKKDHPLIKEYIDRGKFVPASILLEILEESLETLKHKNVILDGIPRNIEQVELLDNFLKKLNGKVDGVIGLTIEKELLIERILNRLVCSNCGTVYNLKFRPPRQDNICDVCAKQIVRREDDTRETLSRRFENYEQQTRPLISLYKEKDLYKEFDVSKNIQTVWKEIEIFMKEKL